MAESGTQSERKESISLSEQYKQFCDDSRSFDTRLWLIPTAAYGTTFLGAKVAFDIKDNWFAQVVILMVIIVVFAAFILQFARYLAFLANTERQINAIEPKIFINGTETTPVHQAGLPAIQAKHWHVRFGSRYSSGKTMFWAMVFSWCCFIVLFGSAHCRT